MLQEPQQVPLQLVEEPMRERVYPDGLQPRRMPHAAAGKTQEGRSCYRLTIATIPRALHCSEGQVEESEE